jgi:hypothetical protein
MPEPDLRVFPDPLDLAPFALKNIRRRMEMHGIWRYVKEIPLVTADRIFFSAGLKLLSALRVREAAHQFVKTPPSGGPHNMIYSLYSKKRQWNQRYSFRSLERPSLQVTLTESGGYYYGDADLDLGNPAMDLLGAVVHFFEILTPGKTDHRKIEEKIAREYAEWLEKEERRV